MTFSSEHEAICLQGGKIQAQAEMESVVLSAA